MKAKIVYMALALALVLSMATAAVVPTLPASAQTTVSATFTVTGGTASGTWIQVGEEGEITSGTITVSGFIIGDVSGTFTVHGTYNPASGHFEMSNPRGGVTLTVGGVPHPAEFIGSGMSFNEDVDLSLWPAPCPMTVDFSGEMTVWTTDGSKIQVSATWSGSGGCLATWTLPNPPDPGTFQSTDFSASGSGTGTAESLATEPAVVDVGPGAGVLELGVLAQAYYDVTGSGSIYLGQYEGNPFAAATKVALGVWLEAATNIIGLNVNWPVELRCYYTDEDVSVIDEHTLRIYRWDGSSWVPVAESGVNTSENYVWAKLYGFSSLAPMGNPAEGEGCFIATAAYGTSTAEEIDVLRAFRDEVLLESTVGSQLVELYYQTSPPVADFISENDGLRTLVRELVVDPIVSVVEAIETLWRN